MEFDFYFFPPIYLQLCTTIGYNSCKQSFDFWFYHHQPKISTTPRSAFSAGFLNFRSSIFQVKLSPLSIEALLHSPMALYATFMPPSSPKFNLYAKIRAPFYPHSIRFLSPLKIRASTTLDYSNVSANDKSSSLKVRITSPSNC